MTQSIEKVHKMAKNAKGNQVIAEILRKACKKIAPVWPLENFVAVNPYLGLADRKFDQAAKELAAAGGVQMTMPLSFYITKIEEGILTSDHLATALKKKGSKMPLGDFMETLNKMEVFPTALLINTVADTLSEATGKDWGRLMLNRVSAWAAAYFDGGQAAWNTSETSKGPFADWKEEASIDRTPELSGLKGFRACIKSLPENHLEAADFVLKELGVSNVASEMYLHGLLLRVGGWAAFAARIDWDNELYGKKDGVLIEFLSILLAWEYALHQTLSTEKTSFKWKSSIAQMMDWKSKESWNLSMQHKLILQEAFDNAMQEQVIAKFKTLKKKARKPKKISTQAIFCIDVRSEVYRRNLEMADNGVETFGFAGFFAFPINFTPLGHSEGEANCPVLLKTGPNIHESLLNKDDEVKAIQARKLNRQIRQVWKSFRSGAITCFSFVSPIGLSYLPKLFSDSFGLTRPVAHPNDAGLSQKLAKDKRVSITSSADTASGIPLAQQITMAKNALNAMSLTDDFADLILVVGHGSSTVNNPHATGYDCGACGGHTGEANAKVAAAVLNNKDVRAGLQAENIFIPIETTFLACLHDTTTDEVTIYNEEDVPESRKAALEHLKDSLVLAGKGARTERALRMPIEAGTDSEKSLIFRSKDWSETRPEWGLAGCDAFVVAPREITQDIDFGGKSFLHSYEHSKDQNYAVLELIMTAPMVVTSWISLQYFASTVDNRVFGSGNKTLHNVTSGIGVFEGGSGDLRVGLPLQAIHDGEKYQHNPVRLNVILRAPLEAMNTILDKHEGVRNLCDNGWLNLLHMDDEGNIAHRYAGNLLWEAIK